MQISSECMRQTCYWTNVTGCCIWMSRKSDPGSSSCRRCIMFVDLTFRGLQKDKTIFAITAVTNGGTGARPSKDGLSATAYPSGVKGTPVEINEAVAPLLFLKKELKANSGGKESLEEMVK